MDMMFVEDCCQILDSMRVPITASDREEGEYPYYGANGIQDYVADYIFDDELVLLAEDGGNFGSKERPIAYRVSGKCWVNNHAHVLKPKDGLDVDYLCYSLMFYKVEGMVNGATRQKLTQAAMRKMQIPSRSMDEQKYIVDKLNCIIRIKEQRQQELQLLDDLIKARFVEMFGHQSHNEKSLRYMTIDDVAEIYLGITHTPTYVDSGVMFISAKNTSGDFLDLSDVKYISREEFEGAPKGSKPQVNDVLFSRVGSNLGHPVILKEELELCTFVSLGFLRSKGIVTSNYLKHWMRDEFFAKQVSEHVKGGGQPNLNTGWLKEFKIIVPDLEKQKEFDDFCNQVDKSKVVVQKALTETQLLFDSLMQQYFG